MTKYNVLSFFGVTTDNCAFIKTFTLCYVRQEHFEYKVGAASSHNICITVIDVSELRKAKHSTVFSKLFLKNKAAVNTVLPLAHTLF